MTPSISLLYVHSRSIGYGRLGVDLANEVRKQGITVYDHLPNPNREEPAVYDLHQGHTSGVSKTVCWVSTPTHAEGWYDTQVPSIFTMWEATVLPEQFRENLHNFETVIVPSQQNVELFSEFHPNVKLVPLGIDPERWHYVPRKMPSTSFRFLLGGSGSRKGGDIARKAFRMAFPHDEKLDGPLPVLVLKSPKGEDVYGGPNIEVVSGRLTDEEETALYESAHCYLQPSRGEGFGLQPLQAIAQGIPTILTGAHGHAGFAHLGIPLSSKLVKSDYFIFGDAGQWWEPDVEELAYQMRRVYENYEEECRRAAASSLAVASSWTWKHTADKFLDALGRDDLHDVEPTGWVAPSMKRYLTVLNQDWTADMGGTFHIFRKGKEYWETADVKRILFEAGYLDPVCLEMGEGKTLADLGLGPEQQKRVDDYTGAAEWCPTCHQRVGGRTKADEIFEELEAAAVAEGRA